MAVTIFRSTDSGAPALPANANYASANFYIGLIKACLVTGYGSKAGAGWSTVYDDTTAGKRRAAFSNGNGCIEFISWGTQSVGMVIWDSITAPGVGRLYDDNFATVMSQGVNGWKSSLVAAPGISSDSINAIGLTNMHSGNVATLAWTIIADDKSAWILFHYPTGHAQSAPSQPLSNTSTQPQIFFGALKSPDLSRGQQGNFFLLNGARNAPTSANAAGSPNSWSWIIGLRTPLNTIPAVANASFYNWAIWSQTIANMYVTNPRSSVRILQPILIGYHGNDVDKPTALAAAYAHYAFASLPGLAEFNEGGSVPNYNYWVYCNQDRGATWNMAPYTINGLTWIPWLISGTYSNLAITDDPAWWA